MVRLILVFLTLIIFQDVAAQRPKVDSLLEKLSGTHSKSGRVDILNELASSEYDYDLQRGFEYATQAYELSSSSQYPKGLALATTLRAYYYFQSGDYKRAKRLFYDGAAVEEQPDEIKGYNYILTGNLFRTQASYDSAKFFYERAIDLLKGGKSPSYLAFAYRSFGKLLGLQWQNDKAEEYFRMAMGIYESSGSNFGKATICFALSELNKGRAQYKLAEEYTTMGCNLATQLGDNFLQLNCVILKGEILFRLGDYLSALETLLRAVEIINLKE